MGHRRRTYSVERARNRNVFTVHASHEELMKSQEHVVWELNGGFVDEQLTKQPCESLWEALNSKVCNSVVVTLTLIEGFIVLAELLVDLKIIQDPLWSPGNHSEGGNASAGGGVGGRRSGSPALATTSTVFTYSSLAILSLFTFEMLLRMVTGRGRFFKKCIELVDAAVVFTAFALDLAFLPAPKDGRGAAVFIVLLRLWRIKQIVQSLVHNTKRQMSHIINAYKRDKIQAEHKVELLILKVEDLEHEVAYLKEKVKKAERDVAHKKKKSKDPLAEFMPHSNRHVPHPTAPHVLPRPPPEGRNQSPPRDQDMKNLYRFAETTVRAILRTASNELVNKERWREDRLGEGRRSRIDSHRDKVAVGEPPPRYPVSDECVEVHKLFNDGGRLQRSYSTPEELDELSEIERIKHVQFDPMRGEKDIPVTTL